MRTYDIAYVPQGTVVGYPTKPLKDLRLDEIENKYLTMCAKSNGNISVCKDCTAKCKYGERALQLMSGDVEIEDEVPLYDGMTMIERAKLENATRRQQKEEEEKKMNTGRLFIKDWYKKAMASKDPVVWVMDAYKIDRNRAMAKLCQWRNRHPEDNVKKPSQVKKISEPKPIPAGFESVEAKLNSLMKQQDEYKKMVDKYQSLYDETKRKVDVLCCAMDIVSEPMNNPF